MSEIRINTLLDQEKSPGKNLRVDRRVGFKAGGERFSKGKDSYRAMLPWAGQRRESLGTQETRG